MAYNKGNITLGVIIMKKQKPVTNIMIDYKQRMTKQELATLLHTIADKLEQDGKFTLTQGDQTHEIEPSASPLVEVEYREKSGKYKFELELEWRPNDTKRSLTIE